MSLEAGENIQAQMDSEVEVPEQKEQFDFEPLDFSDLSFEDDDDPGAPGEEVQRLMREKELAVARAKELETLLAAQSAGRAQPQRGEDDSEEDDLLEDTDPVTRKMFGMVQKMVSKVSSIEEENKSLRQQLSDFQKNTNVRQHQEMLTKQVSQYVSDWNAKSSLNLIDNDDVYMEMAKNPGTSPQRAAALAAKRRIEFLRSNGLEAKKRAKMASNDPNVGKRNAFSQFFGDSELPDIKKVGIDGMVEAIERRLLD